MILRTIVYQSCRPANVPGWMAEAISSVQNWSRLRGFEYRFFGDEIFDLVPDWYQQKAGAYKQISTDYARLVIARNLLNEGYDRVIWADADVLVFNPEGLDIELSSGCAFGREVWVQLDGKGKLKAYKNVHNAFCCFCKDSTFLDFYAEACLRIIGRSNGRLPPQIVGPKLLTALHNIVGFPLIEQVGMISPLVANDIAAGASQAVMKLSTELRVPLAAANLSASLVGQTGGKNQVSDAIMERACRKLIKTKGSVLNDLRPEN